jgi:hypothetical protein
MCGEENGNGSSRINYTHTHTHTHTHTRVMREIMKCQFKLFTKFSVYSDRTRIEDCEDQRILVIHSLDDAE